MAESSQIGIARQLPPWTIVVFLSVIAVVSALDRMVVALLMVPLKHDFAVSDAQLSMLFGMSFALCYLVAGIPLAHIADRGNRHRLLVLGVLLWSFTTLAAAFTRDFTSLLVCRAGVAIGEAALTPVAISMIADLFPRGRRELPMSVFLMVQAISSEGALILCSGAVALATRISNHIDIPAWRLTFMIMGIPGIVIALIFARVAHEPQRTEVTEGSTSMLAALRHLMSARGLYLGMFFGVSFVVATGFGLIAWGSTMLIREHGLPAATAGLSYGVPALAGGVIGTLTVPMVLRMLPRISRVRVIILTAITLAAVGLPLLAMTAMSKNLTTVLFGIAVAQASVAGTALLSPLLVQEVAPAQFRARMVACYLTIVTLLGVGLGPQFVTSLSAFDANATLGAAIARTSEFTLFCALGCYGISLYAIRRGRSARTA